MTSPNVDERFESIAIIGAAGRFPQAKTVGEFWSNLRDGKEGITFFSDEELRSNRVDDELISDPNYVRATGFLEGFDLFDAPFFGFTAREAETMDPQHRLFLECSWEALENAGYDPERYPGSIGVYAGASRNSYYLNLLSRPEISAALGWLQMELSNEKDHLATRVSYKLNLRGPSLSIQTACSTSLVAVHMACQSLLSYQCDMALAGGVSIKVPARHGYLWQPGGIASPDGHCRPFDAEARGTVRGSGVGVVVLKRLFDALADGDSIQALILGSAINNDGALKAGYSAPSQRGQAEVIVAAHAFAGIKADTITYVETHGTGTALGDPIEIAALDQAFRDSTAQRRFCAIGSVKSNIGHLDAAAGIAGLIKTIQSLRHRTIPPTLHFRVPNPEINFEQTAFYVNSTLAPWETTSLPRRAGVSSFGMGGTNAHVILEEHNQPNTAASKRSWQLLLLSAKSDVALDKMTERLREHLKQHPDTNLADVAYTLHVGRKAFPHRRAIVCRSVKDVGFDLDGATRVASGVTRRESLPIVFMFPGQGAQHINMACELYRNESFFKEQVDICSDYLRPHVGFDLREILYSTSESAFEASQLIDSTLIAQPALFTIEYAMAQLVIKQGVRPDALIGHSLGEYVAACVAGVFTLETALSLIAARAKLFQDLPRGTMISVSLPVRQVEQLLDESLSIAAINSPSLCVISGPTDSVERLEARLTQDGIPYRRLRTSHAYHSRMVEPILQAFAEQLRISNPKPPEIRIVSSLTGKWLSDSEAMDPHYWTRQLREVVQFASGIKHLLDNSAAVFLEVGPGQALATLARQQTAQTADAVVLPLSPPHRDDESQYAHWLYTLGRLWTRGVVLDQTAFYAGESRRRIALPTYPFEHQRYWIEPDTDVQSGRTATTNAPLKKKELDEWLFMPSWRSSVAPAKPRFGPTENNQCWLLFLGEDKLSKWLEERLRKSSQHVTTVRVADRFARSPGGYLLNPHHQQDYQTMVEELSAENKYPIHVVHLWTLSPVDVFESQLQLSFYSLLFLVQALGGRDSQKTSISVITHELQSVTECDSGDPATATLPGLLTVIPQEYSQFVCRSVDVSLRADDEREIERLTDQILCELSTSSVGQPVALRGRTRWIQGYEPLRWNGPAAETTRIKPRGVYLITGGLGRIGLALAQHLARTAQARLVLVGRSGPQSDQLRSLESMGAELLVLSADCADEDQMRSVVEKTRKRFGRIDGVIHSAGIVTGESLKPIPLLDVAACKVQLRPKVDGLLVLERVLRGEKLDFCVLNSSLAAVLGGPGYGAYAAANSFMDAFARRQSKIRDFPWISINWDAWRFDEGMNGAGLIPVAMNVEEGMRVLERVLQLPHTPQVIVSTTDFEARTQRWTSFQELNGSEAPVSAFASHPRPDLRDGFVAPANSLECRIAEIWQEFLGVTHVGRKDDFLELGGHSLLAMHIIARLRIVFQVEVPLRSFFGSPTVAGLAEVIEEILIERLEKMRETASP